MQSSFMAQFTHQGGPDPELELRRILEVHLRTPDTTWFPTTLGKGLQLDADSRFLAFCKRPDASIYGITGNIVDRATEMPAIETIRDLYSDFNYPCWWKIKNVKQVRFEKIEQLPGVHIKSGKSAAQSFSGTATFAYWKFDNVELPQNSVKPEPRRSTAPIRRGTGSTKAVDEKLKERTISGDVPPLFGVDFSGGAEGQMGNAKLWIARWDRIERRIVLTQGSQSNFGRRNLPDLICKEKGVWVIDFPFGISKAIADAAGIKSWQDWYRGCSELSSNEDYMTQIRDNLKVAALRAGVPWSKRREIDDHLQTTWFPLFEQLYRQTISGAADVLYPLSQEDARVCILPWQGADFRKSIVSEGFPGAVLTHRLRMDSYGYKGLRENNFYKLLLS